MVNKKMFLVFIFICHRLSMLRCNAQPIDCGGVPHHVSLFERKYFGWKEKEKREEEKKYFQEINWNFWFLGIWNPGSHKSRFWNPCFLKFGISKPQTFEKPEVTLIEWLPLFQIYRIFAEYTVYLFFGVIQICYLFYKRKSVNLKV